MHPVVTFISIENTCIYCCMCKHLTVVLLITILRKLKPFKSSHYGSYNSCTLDSSRFSLPLTSHQSHCRREDNPRLKKSNVVQQFQSTHLFCKLPQQQSIRASGGGPFSQKLALHQHYLMECINQVKASI